MRPSFFACKSRALYAVGLKTLGVGLTAWFSFSLLPAQAPEEAIQKQEKGAYQVATLGAATSSSLLEGTVGCLRKGQRYRFACHSAAASPGFIGPLTAAKPTSLKDQPGIFPAPLMGPAALRFTFTCQQPQGSFRPIVVKPDGTLIKGKHMSITHAPQTLLIPSPAQAGIYTLFFVPQDTSALGGEALVEVTTSTSPQKIKTLKLQSFQINQDQTEQISKEFVYLPL